MTGEITLRGHVLPIGGLKEKILAARRAGIESIVCPRLNKKELDEVPSLLRRGITFHLVDDVDEVLKLTDGYGCDVYIEATGHPDAVAQGLRMICKLGTFVEFSVMREPVTVDWTIIGDTKELNIHGAHLSPHTYPIAISMLAKGLLPIDRIVTHQMPLAEFQKGIDLVADGTASIKVTLTP